MRRPEPGVPTREAVTRALATVRDPELDEPLTALGFVDGMDVTAARVEVRLRLPTYFCGANVAYYPPEVTSVLAIEPEPYLRPVAEHTARQAPVPVEVVDGTAEHLPAGDATFDATVVSLVLCSVADPHAALTEIRRVLRPGGQLRFLEHVRADTPRLLRVQRLLDATIWPLLCGGDHTSRDTATAITTAGFTVERLDRFHLPEERIPFPTSPHILGMAARPDDPFRVSLRGVGEPPPRRSGELRPSGPDVLRCSHDLRTLPQAANPRLNHS